MKRLNWFFKLCKLPTSLYLNTRYTIKFEGELPKPPLVVLPKHQRHMDIPLEGIYVHNTTGIVPYFIMRPLPCKTILEALGGIPIARGKEIRKGKYDAEQGKAINEQATEQAINAIKTGNPLIIHPEGTRHPDTMGNIRIKPDSILDTILREQKNYQAIAFVPLGIHYNKEITLKAGEPFFTDDPKSLEERLMKELPKLSGL